MGYLLRSHRTRPDSIRHLEIIPPLGVCATAGTEQDINSKPAGSRGGLIQSIQRPHGSKLISGSAQPTIAGPHWHGALLFAYYYRSPYAGVVTITEAWHPPSEIARCQASSYPTAIGLQADTEEGRALLLVDLHTIPGRFGHEYPALIINSHASGSPKILFPLHSVGPLSLFPHLRVGI